MGRQLFLAKRFSKFQSQWRVENFVGLKYAFFLSSLGLQSLWIQRTLYFFSLPSPFEHLGSAYGPNSTLGNSSTAPVGCFRRECIQSKNDTVQSTSWLSDPVIRIWAITIIWRQSCSPVGWYCVENICALAYNTTAHSFDPQFLSPKGRQHYWNRHSHCKRNSSAVVAQNRTYPTTSCFFSAMTPLRSRPHWSLGCAVSLKLLHVTK